MTKRYSLFLAIILLLFVSLFIMLCCFSRLATDDYWYIWNVNNTGILQGVKNQYMEWCGRFVSEFSRNVMYHYFQLNQNYYSLVPFTAFLLLVSGVYKALGSISEYFGFSIQSSQKWLASGCFAALLFFLSIDKGECWFWYNALNEYLLSIVACRWAIGFLFQRRSTILTYIILFICMFYVGGGSEVYSVIFGLIATVFLFLQYRNSGSFRQFMSVSLNKKLLVFYKSLAIAFIIVVVAPGNYLRATLLPKSQFFYSFFITAKSFVKLTVLILPPQIPYIIAFSVIFILIGKQIKETNPDLFIIPFKKFFLKLTIYLASILFIFFFVVAYLMVETGPARVWLLCSFLVTVYICLLCFYSGYSNLFDKKKTEVLITLSIILGLGFMLSTLKIQYTTASAYSSAIDSRNTYLIETNKTIKKDTLIKLTPLPECGMLYSSDIQPDTSHFTNQELRLGFNLKFHVYVEKKAP